MNQHQKLYTTCFEGVISDARGTPQGLAFPILIPGYDKPITDPAAWREFLQDYRQLEASERNPDPWLEYDCNCVFPEQVCGGCKKILTDYERRDRTGELTF